MPEWITPLLCVVCPPPTSPERSRITTREPGRRRSSSAAVASPRMPPPTTARSQFCAPAPLLFARSVILSSACSEQAPARLSSDRERQIPPTSDRPVSAPARARRAVGDRLRAMPVPLRLILVVALVEALAWSVALAPLQGPDESAHYTYVQYFSETGHRPIYNGGTSTISTDTGTAYSAFNLYGLVGRADARPFWSEFEYNGWNKAQKKLKKAQREDASGPNA